MSSTYELVKEQVRDFIEIQEYMDMAKKANASELYDRMKSRYVELKALLELAGVNLAELDRIKNA